MKRNSLRCGVAACLLTLTSLLSGAVLACTIGEEAQVQLPFNTTTFSNADRIAIANSVIEAKKWPDVKIQAVVIAGAYIHENDIERLKNVRADNAKAYLQQLGIESTVLALSCAHTALACDGPSNMPGWDFDVRFDKDSSDLSIAELAKLSAWSTDMHNRFSIIDAVSVVGLAEPTEKDPKALAQQRAANVKAALDQFSIRGERNSVIARIYTLPFPASEFDDTGRRVEITFGPGCPDHCCPNLNPIPKTP
ncbi:hypothetical protein [Burkholderia ambifaria]